MIKYLIALGFPYSNVTNRGEHEDVNRELLIAVALISRGEYAKPGKTLSGEKS